MDEVSFVPSSDLGQHDRSAAEQWHMDACGGEREGRGQRNAMHATPGARNSP